MLFKQNVCQCVFFESNNGTFVTDDIFLNLHTAQFTTWPYDSLSTIYAGK